MLDQAKEVLTVEAEGILAIRDRIGVEFTRAVELIAACPSRLVVTGIGKSGIIGQKITATMNSIGTPSLFLHPVEAMHGDLGMVSSTDVLLAISYSGETTELNGLLLSLKDRNVPVISMTGKADSTLARFSSIVLDTNVPKEACPLGLAPTTSTTATLALGDALAVSLLSQNRFQAEDFRRNHPGGSLGDRLKVEVSEVMISGNSVPSVSCKTTIGEAVVELNNKSLGAVVVIDDDQVLCGIVTDGDLRRMLTDGKIVNTDNIKKIMTSNPVTIHGGIMAADALSLMQQREITVLAVVDDTNHLQGVLHLHDLLGKGEFRFLI